VDVLSSRVLLRPSDLNRSRDVRVPYSVIYDLRGDQISALRIYFPHEPADRAAHPLNQPAIPSSRRLHEQRRHCCQVGTCHHRVCLTGRKTAHPVPSKTEGALSPRNAA
jgi:hypothetical protein